MHEEKSSHNPHTVPTHLERQTIGTCKSMQKLVKSLHNILIKIGVHRKTTFLQTIISNPRKNIPVPAQTHPDAGLVSAQN